MGLDRGRGEEEDHESKQDQSHMHPIEDQEYQVVLGQSLVPDQTIGANAEESNEQQRFVQPGHPEEVFVSFRYEFQPASIDKTRPGLVNMDDSNGVQVLVGTSTGAAGGIQFKGKVVENKSTDCLLIFDGVNNTFRLEYCPFSCTQLRHVRAPSAKRQVKPSSLPSLKKSGGNTNGSRATSVVSTSLPAAAATVKRPRGRPKKVVMPTEGATSKKFTKNRAKAAAASSEVVIDDTIGGYQSTD